MDQDRFFRDFLNSPFTVILHFDAKYPIQLEKFSDNFIRKKCLENVKGRDYMRTET